jgi:hypothetical protein
MPCSPQHGVLIACKVRLWGRIFEHLLGLPIHRRDSPHSSRARIVTSGGAPDTYLMTAYAPYSTTLRIANCATSSSIHSHIRAHRDGDRCQAAPALGNATSFSYTHRGARRNADWVLHLSQILYSFFAHFGVPARYWLLPTMRRVKASTC